MPGQPLQPSAHVDELVHLHIPLIEFTKFRIDLQSPVDGNVEFVGDHLRYGVHKSIGQIHDPSHVPDHALCSQRTESHDLNHFFRSIFPSHIIDHFLPALEAEIHVDIRHGHTLRIQESLEQQIIADGIDVGDVQAVGDDASCGGSSPGAHRNVVFSGVVDEIPDDQEVVHIAHLPDNIQFVIHSFFQRPVVFGVTLLQARIAQLVQIAPGIVSGRNLEMGQFRDAELDLHMAAIRDPLRVFHRFPGIGKQPFHLLFALDVILSAFIAHPVLVRQLFRRLNAQQDIVRPGVLRMGVVHIVGTDQTDIQIPGDLQEGGVHCLLLRDTVILQLQEVIILPEDLPVFQGALFGLIDQPLLNISGHLPCQTGGQGYDPFVVFPQQRLVHPRLIIVPFREALADNFHQIGITRIIFRQEHQMIISVFSSGQFPVEPGIGRHIYFAADDGVDPLFLRRPVKIDHTVHNAVIRDGRSCHPELFHLLDIFFDFIGTIQQTVFCMDV